MKKSSRVISTLLLGATLTTMSANVFAVESPETIKTKVLAGESRYETAIEVSKHGWKSADTVVLVNAYAIPDALAATPMAKMNDAPILLTEANTLTGSTKAELQRLQTKNVIVVGGEGVVSNEVVKALKDMKIRVDRVSGVDRIETALEVAKKIDANKIAVVNGREGLADALSVAAPAAKEGMAIILSNKDDLGASEKYISKNNFEKTYIIGGEGVVSKKVENKLGNVERLQGSDRNETNSEVIKEFYSNKELDNIYLAKDGKANESELVDALAAGPLAGKENSPVVLVGNKLSKGQKEQLANKVVTDVYEVGFGVNANTVKEIVDALSIKEVEAAIESAKPVDVNKVEVKFNRAVDTDAAKFELLLNKSDKTTEKVDVKVTFNKEKTAATLETTNKLVAGDYTLNVSGLTEKPLISKIKVEAEAYKEIKVNADSIILNTQMEVPFQVLNQYGLDYNKADMETLKTDIAVNAYNVTKKTTIKSSVEYSKENGLYVQLEDKVNKDKVNEYVSVGDEIKITLTIGSLVKQVTLPVLDRAVASTIELKEVSPLENSKRITVEDKGLEIPYTMKDQYGNDVKLPLHSGNTGSQDNVVTIGRVQFTSSDSDIIDVDTFEVDDNGKLTFDTGLKAGTAIITAVALDNGSKFDLKVTVNASPVLSSIEVVDFTTAYEKAGTATLIMDNIKGLDQYGDEHPIKTDLITVTPVSNDGFVTNQTTTFTGMSDKAGEDSYNISIKEDGKDISTNITLRSVPTSEISEYKIKSSKTNILKYNTADNKVSEKVTLELEGFFGNERVALAKKPIAYVSSDVNIVKVDNVGKITVNGLGEVIITARRELQNGIQTKVPKDVATLKLTVSDADPFIQQIKFEKEFEKLSVGGNETLTLTAKDQYGDDFKNANLEGRFSSENPKVATVNGNGKVTAQGKGTTTITFTANNGESATCKIIVE